VLATLFCKQLGIFSHELFIFSCTAALLVASLIANIVFIWLFSLVIFSVF
jgi:hypothetical protein